MDSKLVRLKSFDSALAADAARVALEHEGIAARLDGVSVGHALNHVGTALGGVGLLVNANDAERAAEIVAELAREAELQKSPWYCGRCREDVEATFDVCWSCGNDRRDVEIQRPPKTVESSRASSLNDDFSENDAGEDAAADGNPYRSPRATASRAIDRREEDLEPEDAEREAMIARAWRASILGIVFLPILLHLYSMWLLLRASFGDRKLSSEASRKFYLAFAVNLVAGGVWGIVVGYW